MDGRCQLGRQTDDERQSGTEGRLNIVSRWWTVIMSVELGRARRARRYAHLYTHLYLCLFAAPSRAFMATPRYCPYRLAPRHAAFYCLYRTTARLPAAALHHATAITRLPARARLPLMIWP